MSVDAMRLLRLVTGAELLTLAVLLVNLGTVHRPAVSSAVGPVHGLCYVSVVVLALLADGQSWRARLLALIPAIGGILAIRAFAGGGPDQTTRVR